MTATIFLDHQRAIYIGPGHALPPHRCAVDMLVIGLDQPLTYRDSTTPPVSVPHRIVPGGRVHEITSRGRVATIYINPRERFCACQTSDRPETKADLPDPLEKCSVNAALTALLEHAGVTLVEKNVGRLEMVLSVIEQPHSDALSVGDLAADLGLSIGQLDYLCRTELGISFRRYQLWQRITTALAALGSGHRLEQAATRGNFSSAGHLSATFKAAMGLSIHQLMAPGIRFVSNYPDAYQMNANPNAASKS